MANELKAIETEYNGYLFRSRLEARWAVFLDKLGIEYQYEKEGYDLEGIYYLPDFFLPSFDCFLEIKGDTNDLTVVEESLNKLILLHKHSGKNCYLFSDFDKYGFCIGNFNNSWSGWDENNGENRKNELTHLTILNGFNYCQIIKGDFPSATDIVFDFNPDDVMFVFQIPDEDKDLKTLQQNQDFFHGIYGSYFSDNDEENLELTNTDNHHKLLLNHAGTFLSNGAFFGQDVMCNTPGILPLAGSYRKFCNCNPRSITQSPLMATQVLNAAKAGRQARFEHGANGNTPIPFRRKPKK